MLSANEARALSNLMEKTNQAIALESLKEFCEEVAETGIHEAVSRGEYVCVAYIPREVFDSALNLSQVRTEVKKFFEPYGYKATVTADRRVGITW